MKIKPWTVDEGKVKSIKVEDKLLHVNPNSQVNDPLELVKTLCEARKMFVDVFGVDVDEIFQMQKLGEDEAQLSLNPKIQNQVQNTDLKETSIKPGAYVDKMGNIIIYSNVINRIKEELTGTFGSKDIVKILKDFWPNNKESTLYSHSRLYIKFLFNNNEIKQVTTQGKTKIYRFISNQDSKDN